METSLAKEETPIFKAIVYPPASLKLSSLPALSLFLQSYLEDNCKEKLQGYIWQREAPRVTVDDDDDDDDTVEEGKGRLVVSMRHGGSIEDEWLLVHLLMLASKEEQFSETTLLQTLEGRSAEVRAGGNDGLVINAKDEDGQFILIEAAEHLPDCVQPDNADGRLWIYQGHFHLITPEVHVGEVILERGDASMEGSQARSLRHSTALPLIRSSFYNTKTTLSFEDAIIKQRLFTFPDLSWAMYTQHNTLAYLPLLAAKALHKYPQLLATAAEAFDGREGPNDARSLREMKVFGPFVGITKDGSKSSDVLLVKVKLPRRLYATLLSQRYFPSKAFGEDWRTAISEYWESLEQASRGENPSIEEDRRSEGRRRDLGCKITCGLELALVNAKERLKEKQSDLFAVSSDSDLRNSSSYTSFLAALTRIGFFGENIKDSKEWKAEEAQALNLLRYSKPNLSKLDDEHVSDNLQHLVDLVKEKDGETTITPPHISSTLPFHALALEEDPDGFLFDVPEGVKAPTSTHDQDGETEEERAAMTKVNAFADKLQGFVDGKGDVDGALFEDEDMENDDEDEDEDEDEEEKEHTMTQEERDQAMKGLVPGLSQEEWGAKSKVKLGETPNTMLVDAVDISSQKESKANSNASHTTAGFSRRIRYDGASDSEESVDDEILRAGDTDEDRKSRAKWLDMERELAEDEAHRKMAKEDGDLKEQEHEEEDGMDVRFGQDELMNFVEFTRKELGLSMEQYEEILQKRRDRGAYVPEFKHKNDEASIPIIGTNKKVAFDDALKQTDLAIPSDGNDEEINHKTSRQMLAERREEKEKALRNERTTAEEKDNARRRAQKAVEEVETDASQRTASSIHSIKDPFAKLMQAMDEELAKHRGKQGTGNGQDSINNVDHLMQEDEYSDEEDEDDQMLSAEDAELLEKMLHNGPPASLRTLMEKQNANDSKGLSSVEQEVMQSMLASYQAQMGGAGPVGALAGRLGIGPLPFNSDR